MQSLRAAVASFARILLVEDDPALRCVLSELLEENGYEVACATDGRDALAQLGTAPAPSVILLDLAMPVMDGWSFRAEQRRNPRLAAIPTVVLSGSLGADPRALEGLDVAATLAKPFEIELLIATVRRLCVSC
jgi:CheY-like chemotaxis protein